MDEQSSHDDVCRYVGNALKEIKYAYYKKEKCRLTKNIFDYLIVNKWFLKKNTKFFEKCIWKLHDLKSQVTPSYYNLFEIDKYIEIFENIDKEFEEKELDVPKKEKI